MLEKVAIGVVFTLLAILLPIVPAYILYKFLPQKKSEKGAFKGLTIRSRGAFGAYFITFLVLSVLLFAYFNRPVPSDYEVWRVEGWVKYEQADDEKYKSITINPEYPEIIFNPDGSFVITGLMLPTKINGPTDVTSISIEANGYETISIPISKSFTEEGRFVHDSIKKVDFNDKTKTITINSPDEPITPSPVDR